MGSHVLWRRHAAVLVTGFFMLGACNSGGESNGDVAQPDGSAEAAAGDVTATDGHVNAQEVSDSVPGELPSPEDTVSDASEDLAADAAPEDIAGGPDSEGPSCSPTIFCPNGQCCDVATGECTGWTDLAAVDPLAPGRTQHGAAWDSAEERMLVFGGTNMLNEAQNDVWALTVSGTGEAAWKEITSIESELPPPRSQHVVAYDSVKHRLLVFGGSGANSAYLSDVWALSFSPEGPFWQELTPEVGASPMGRKGATGIYDSAQERLVIYGGDVEGLVKGDVWALPLGGAEGWQLLDPAGDTPPNRAVHTAVYDPIGQRMIAFGGFNSEIGGLQDVVVLSLDEAPAWTVYGPADGEAVWPVARQRHATAWDSKTDRLLLSGGLPGGGGIAYQDVWTMTLDNGPTWALVSQWGPYGSSHSAVWDPTRERLVGFAGGGGAYSLKEFAVPTQCFQ